MMSMGNGEMMPAGDTGELPELDSAALILNAAERGFERVLGIARSVTENGRLLDEHQVLAQRIASHATELKAARELLAFAQRSAAADAADAASGAMALFYAADTAHRLRSALQASPADFGLAETDTVLELPGKGVLAAIRRGLSQSLVRTIGLAAISGHALANTWLEDEALRMTRESVRAFTRAEVAPLAERIHRDDELVPNVLISRMAELGFFAASIPEQYGGSGLGYPVMVITTEELSAGSLAAAGSLSTRPEILARALLVGGTEEQRRHWLPRIASGELMVAIAVTEPDAGSDVAALTTRADPADSNGRAGYRINGTKAWSTFAGRAELIALLARTDPDRAQGYRGLSLFIVEKQPHAGHDFAERQDGGGALTGRAIRTPGYRGMHSYLLSFDNFFVPAENLVGEENGRGRGFYLQMSGFAAGRLQTGGRALGVAQAALAKTVEYVSERRQFGRPIGEYQLTQYRLGRMATQLAAARQLTYAAARTMEAAERGGEGAPTPRAADLAASMSKLLASDVAASVTQEGQLLHGGWGYAEETPISRYVVDAQVLPIFEGAKPVLELKVIGASLLRGDT
jgi:(2S)-methylsuccinyl-CoA dehydrogenase